jgi:hypothetical protein
VQHSVPLSLQCPDKPEDRSLLSVFANKPSSSPLRISNQQEHHRTHSSAEKQHRKQNHLPQSNPLLLSLKTSSNSISTPSQAHNSSLAATSPSALPLQLSNAEPPTHPALTATVPQCLLYSIGRSARAPSLDLRLPCGTSSRAECGRPNRSTTLKLIGPWLPRLSG